MIRRLLTLSLLLGALACARGASTRITASVIVTNAPTIGLQTLTVNGDVRTWTNVVYTPSAQILTNATISGSLTNLLRHVAIYPFAGPVVIRQVSTNQLDLIGSVDQAMSVSAGGLWASVTYSAQTVEKAWTVRVPGTVETATVATNNYSLLVTALNDFSTNAFSQSAAALSNFVGRTNAQTVANKMLVSTDLLGTNANHITPVISNMQARVLLVPYGTTNSGIWFAGSGLPYYFAIAADASGVPSIYGMPDTPPMTNGYAAAPGPENILTRAAAEQWFAALNGANVWTGTNTFGRLNASLIVGGVFSGPTLSNVITAQGTLTFPTNYPLTVTGLSPLYVTNTIIAGSKAWVFSGDGRTNQVARLVDITNALGGLAISNFIFSTGFDSTQFALSGTNTAIKTGASVTNISSETTLYLKNAAGLANQRWIALYVDNGGIFDIARVDDTGTWTANLIQIDTANFGSFGLGVGSQAVSPGGVAVGPLSLATTHATAIGQQSQATADFSTAISYNSQVSGDSAIGIGKSVKMDAKNAIAIGNGVVATNYPEQGIAIGYLSRVESTNAIVIGPNSLIESNANFSLVLGSGGQITNSLDAVSIGTTNLTIDSPRSVIVGNNIVANGAANGVAIGDQSSITGISAVALGEGAVSSGLLSLAVGPESVASAQGATAIGYLARATNQDEVVIGTTNNTVEIPGNLHVAGTITPPQGGGSNVFDSTQFAVINGTNIYLTNGVMVTNLVNQGGLVIQTNTTGQKLQVASNGGANYALFLTSVGGTSEFFVGPLNRSKYIRTVGDVTAPYIEGNPGATGDWFLGTSFSGAGIDFLRPTHSGNYSLWLGGTNATVYHAGLSGSAVVAKTSNFTADSAASTYRIDATSASITNTLPTAVGISGRTYVLKRVDASTEWVVIDGEGSETIDGATTTTLTNKSCITIQSDGANWMVIGAYP